MKTKLQNPILIDYFKQKSYSNNLPTNQNGWDIIKNNKKCHSDKEIINLVIEGQSNDKSVDEICSREGISMKTFYQWTQDFLNNNQKESSVQPKSLTKISDEDKFKIVIEGKNGESSIAEICNRENISHDTFLSWSQTFLDLRKTKLNNLDKQKSNYKKNKLLFSKISNSLTFNYIENFIDFSNKNNLIVTKSNSIKLDKINKADNIICLEKVNDIRFINKYFEKINSKLPNNGIFVGCLETFNARRHRMLVNKIPIINEIFFGLEFLIKRIIPKLEITKKHYFNLTNGKDRLLSKSEGLGRLVSSGFKIMDYKPINGLLYFVVKKEKQPIFDLSPSYGPIYKMPRLGKNGEIIKVYKFRTMHPYSEYLQDYVLRANGYAESGKPAEDFRIPTWGKFMRRFWLDEIPQLINVIKGDMKLVGVRPVSKRYFQDIPKEMQKLRLTQLPGCIPPYVALNRKGNVMSVLQAEKDYLEEKIKNPYFTDIKYFFTAIFNIIFKHKRSA